MPLPTPLRRLWGDHWGLRRAFILWAVIFAGFVTYAKLGGLEGDYAPKKPPFSRKACLDRESQYYQGRNPDMDHLSDELISRIAAVCAREESDYYHSN
jgi:hypothetical protein